MLFFSFKKGLNGQNQSSSDYHHHIKIPLPAKFLIAPMGRYPRVSQRCWEHVWGAVGRRGSRIDTWKEIGGGGGGGGLNLYLSFKSSSFSTWTKIHDKNLNILRTKRVFEVKWKVFFIIFKGFSNAKNCLWHESAPLMKLIPWRENIEKNVITGLKLFYE